MFDATKCQYYGTTIKQLITDLDYRCHDIIPLAEEMLKKGWSLLLKDGYQYIFKSLWFQDRDVRDLPNGTIVRYEGDIYVVTNLSVISNFDRSCEIRFFEEEMVKVIL